MSEYTTVKLSKSSLEFLRIIAKMTDESYSAVLERILGPEAERVVSERIERLRTRPDTPPDPA